MTTIAEQLLLLVAGAVLTLIGATVKTWLDRRTHCSARIFELRIESMRQIWQAFNEMKGYYAFRIELGFQQWNADYAEQAGEGLTRFRQAIDNAQIVLPAEVIDILRKIDEAYYVYHRDEQGSDAKLHGEVRKCLEELASAVNQTMSKQTHTIRLRFRT